MRITVNPTSEEAVLTKDQMEDPPFGQSHHSSQVKQRVLASQ